MRERRKAELETGRGRIGKSRYRPFDGAVEVVAERDTDGMEEGREAERAAAGRDGRRRWRRKKKRMKTSRMIAEQAGCLARRLRTRR
jgi:hypothetical protein